MYEIGDINLRKRGNSRNKNIRIEDSQEMPQSRTSRKHAYIILTPLNSLLYSKTGVYRLIH